MGSNRGWQHNQVWGRQENVGCAGAPKKRRNQEGVQSSVGRTNEFSERRPQQPISRRAGRKREGGAGKLFFSKRSGRQRLEGAQKQRDGGSFKKDWLARRGQAGLESVVRHAGIGGAAHNGRRGRRRRAVATRPSGWNPLPCGPGQLGGASLRHAILCLQLCLQRLELSIAGIVLVDDGRVVCRGEQGRARQGVRRGARGEKGARARVRARGSGWGPQASAVGCWPQDWIGRGLPTRDSRCKAYLCLISIQPWLQERGS